MPRLRPQRVGRRRERIGAHRRGCDTVELTIRACFFHVGNDMASRSAVRTRPLVVAGGADRRVRDTQRLQERFRRCVGWRIPIRQGPPSDARPRANTSPPALIAKSAIALARAPRGQSRSPLATAPRSRTSGRSSVTVWSAWSRRTSRKLAWLACPRACRQPHRCDSCGRSRRVPSPGRSWGRRRHPVASATASANSNAGTAED